MLMYINGRVKLDSGHRQYKTTYFTNTRRSASIVLWGNLLHPKSINYVKFTSYSYLATKFSEWLTLAVNFTNSLSISRVQVGNLGKGSYVKQSFNDSTK